jgi:hypothetical protein
MSAVYDNFIARPRGKVLDFANDEKQRLLDRATKSGGKGLRIKMNISNSGRRINNRIYLPAGQKNGIAKATGRPVIKDHEDRKVDSIIGLIDLAEFTELDDEAMGFFESVADFLEVKRALYSDDYKRIVSVMHKHKLLLNDKWPGIAEIQGELVIKDQDAIQRFLDGRFFNFSAGADPGALICSHCLKDWVKLGGSCGHKPGRVYDGKLCFHIVPEYTLKEVSVVVEGANRFSHVRSFELQDSAGNEITFEDGVQDFDAETVYMTDAVIEGDKMELTPELLAQLKDELRPFFLELLKQEMPQVEDKKEEPVAVVADAPALTQDHVALLDRILGAEAEKAARTEDSVAKAEYDQLKDSYTDALRQIEDLKTEKQSLQDELAQKNVTVLDNQASTQENKEEDDDVASVADIKKVEGESVSTNSQVKLTDNLSDYERAIVSRYQSIRETSGVAAANDFITLKKHKRHIPRNFDINRYTEGD